MCQVVESGSTMGPPGHVEVPWGGLDLGSFHPPPVTIGPRLFLGSVAQCVAWPRARTASLPASASLPPLRLKTKLGHGQTLSVYRSIISLLLSLRSFFFFSLIGD